MDTSLKWLHGLLGAFVTCFYLIEFSQVQKASARGWQGAIDEMQFMQGTGDGHALPRYVRDERRNDETKTTMGRVGARTAVGA